MLIDWFTVIAQMVNFLILVWLLKRFLYEPILNAIHERETKIKTKLQNAEDELSEARQEKAAFQSKNENFEKERENLLNQAAEEAENLRRQLLKEARKEAKALRIQLEASIREEQENLNREIVERTQREVFAIARKVLSDLASANVEAHIIEVFLGHLKQMEEKDRAPLEAVLKTPPHEAVVRSAFELGAEERRQITTALNGIAGMDIRLHFEKAPRLIGGVEITAGGYKIAWSINDYIGSLEEQIGAMLNNQEPNQSETTTKAASNESSSK